MNKQEIIDWIFEKLDDLRNEHSQDPWNDYKLGKHDGVEELLEELINYEHTN